MVPTFFKARNAAVVNLLIGYGSMDSPALRMQASSPDIHLSILFSKGKGH